MYNKWPLLQVMAWWQAVAWTSIVSDLWNHLTSLGHSEFSIKPLMHIIKKAAVHHLFAY